MKTEREKIAQQLIEGYRAITGTTEVVLTCCDLNNYVETAVKSGKNIASVEPIQIEGIDITPMVIEFNPYLLGKNSETSHFLDQSQIGTFQITLADNGILLVSRRFTSEENSTSVEQVSVATKTVWQEWAKVLVNRANHLDKIPTGISRVFAGISTSSYKEVKRIPLTPIIHPVLKDIEEDIEFFFNNVPTFMQFEQPGVRKYMLIGEPGTGKSSICFHLAATMKEQHSIVFATQINAVKQHLAKAAEEETSSIIILEDAETTLENAESSVLNLLDGIDQPQNPKGTVIIMTTNHPDRLEPRILQRPGRVDRIFRIGVLKGNDAVACAKIYLNQEHQIRESTLAQLVDGLTGAQIREFARSCASLANSTRQPMTDEIAQQVCDRMKEDLSSAYKLSQPENNMTRSKDVGFCF